MNCAWRILLDNYKIVGYSAQLRYYLESQFDQMSSVEQKWTGHKAEFLKEVAREIEAHMNNGQNLEECFVTKESLDNIWTKSRLQSLCRLAKLEEGGDGYLREHLLCTISILVRIRWKEWDRFREIFYDLGRNSCRGDENIEKYTLAELEGADFLNSKTFARDFDAHRYAFIPIAIVEETVREYSTKMRLPIIFPENGAEPIGEGGYGTVTKAKIASSQLYRGGIRQPVSRVEGLSKQLLTAILESICRRQESSSPKG